MQPKCSWLQPSAAVASRFLKICFRTILIGVLLTLSSGTTLCLSHGCGRENRIAECRVSLSKQCRKEGKITKMVAIHACVPAQLMLNDDTRRVIQTQDCFEGLCQVGREANVNNGINEGIHDCSTSLATLGTGRNCGTSLDARTVHLVTFHSPLPQGACESALAM
eukprot:5275678-Amphidinium_carterae.1